jgi:hypothetical protein
MNITAIVSILCVFVAAPSIVFLFIFAMKKNKLRLEELRYKRDMLELELEKERTHLKLIEAENAKYDRIIASDSGR